RTAHRPRPRARASSPAAPAATGFSTLSLHAALPIFDLQGRGLEHSSALDGHEAGKPIDRRVTNETRWRRAEVAGELLVSLHHGFESSQRTGRRWHPSTAVGISDDIVGKQGSELRHVSVSRCDKEGGGDLHSLLFHHGEARTAILDVRASATCKLAARRGLATDRLRNLLERETEHVVKKECGPLKRRQALERHHERQRDVVDGVDLLHLEDGFRQPRSYICLPYTPSGPQLVEAQTRDHRTKQRRRFADTLSIHAHP